MAYGLGAFRTDIFTDPQGKLGKAIGDRITSEREIDYLKMLRDQSLSSLPTDSSEEEQLKLIEAEIKKLEDELSLLELGNKPINLNKLGGSNVR